MYVSELVLVSQLAGTWHVGINSLQAHTVWYIRVSILFVLVCVELLLMGEAKVLVALGHVNNTFEKCWTICFRRGGLFEQHCMLWS